MIKANCFVCRKTIYKSPSKLRKRPCCSRECQIKIASKDIVERGIPYRITKESYPTLRPKALKAIKEQTTGEKNYAWKGERVSYRGLHQWIRRKKGLPTKCVNCSKESTKPRIIQWANIDGKYKRNVDDFVALCCSCHKYHDMKLKSTPDAQLSN